MIKLALVLTTAVAALSATPARPAPAACALGAGDQAWLDRSMRAWDYSTRHISGIGHVKKIQAVFFDKDCVVTSKTAMNGGPGSWSATLHHGKVTLPDGGQIAPQVISFAGSGAGSDCEPSLFRHGGAQRLAGSNQAGEGDDA